MTVTLSYPKELDKDHVVMPGDNVELICDLLSVFSTFFQTDIFAGEGGLTVGTAIVTQVLE